VRSIAAELVVDARADLGEGPVWDERRGVLLWVDIHAGRVHTFDPGSGADETIEVGQPVGAVAVRESGGLVLAVRDGFALLDRDEAAPRVIAALEQDEPRTRMNDGKCDAAGRFWAGTMDEEERSPLGSLYRLDPDGTASRMLGDLVISNGLGWSPDRSTMYHVDSPTRRVDAFDFDLASGAIANRRTVVALEPGAGDPDGLTVDAEGFLWVALWGGSAVRRYSPSGRLDAVVDIPASQVTSCTFGGPDLDELYVTTARRGLDARKLASEPAAGGIWRARPAATGQPAARFSG
jgi:sugar lactone lactonase YvrE